MKSQKLFFITVILAVLLATGCSGGTKLPYQLIDSGAVMKTRTEFLEESKWDLDEDFEQIDDWNPLSAYEKKELTRLSGKEVSSLIVFTEEGMVNLIRYWKSFDNAEASRNYAYQIYDDIVERYGKPDTSKYVGDSLTYQREVSVKDFPQTMFEWWDIWLLPPVMDDPCTSVSVSYSYNEQSGDGEKYLVMFTIAPYSLRNTIYREG